VLQAAAGRALLICSAATGAGMERVLRALASELSAADREAVR
jgi:hypothetical protein